VTAVDLSQRIGDLARAVGLEVSGSATLQIAHYIELLSRWNRRINLTSLSLAPPTDEAISQLILEPIAAASLLANAHKSGTSWVDVGSGGGSPAIPLKIVQPHLPLVLVESVGKKSAFLREAVRSLQLDQVEVVTGRFETFASAHPAAASVITMRAVRADNALLRAVASALMPGGMLAIFSNLHAEFPVDAGTPMIRTATTPLPGERHAVHWFMCST
jgi:16S rRNA (guanine527-N7)-methyltransferase